MVAIQHGDVAEDRSQGHSLVADPTTRAVQERFISYANRDLVQLRLVLRSSSDAAHRALAAQILGYAPDKQAVVDDLVYAMTDLSDVVRNNAMRALLVFAEIGPKAGSAAPRIPDEPFIAFVHSPVWTDRNKASGALMTLSAGRNPMLLSTLRKNALRPLVEMARWKSDAHAKAACILLGRIAGYLDDAAQAVWERGERELAIAAALRGQYGRP